MAKQKDNRIELRMNSFEIACIIYHLERDYTTLQANKGWRYMPFSMEFSYNMYAKMYYYYERILSRPLTMNEKWKLRADGGKPSVDTYLCPDGLQKRKRIKYNPQNK